MKVRMSIEIACPFFPLLYGADVNHDTMPYWSYSIAVSKLK